MAGKKNDILPSKTRLEIAEDIQKRVDELTFPQLAELTNIEKNNELKRIESALREYLERYERTERIIMGVTKNLDLSNEQNKNAKLYGIYHSLLTSDMESLLRDGYILIENLRETFTGEKIVYQVGMNYSVSSEGTKRHRELIIKEMNLAEILSYAKPDIQWRGIGTAGFKLRAASKKEDFEREYNNQKNIIKEAMTGVNSLYPKVIQAIQGKSSGRKINEGNVFEVYMNFKNSGYADHPPGPKDPRKLTAERIVEKYAEVKAGTQSFVSGGDIGINQVKLLSTAPSIASLSTIGNALKLILTYIKDGQRANVTIDHIKKNVFSKEFDTLSRKGLNELLEDVNNSLGSLDFDKN